jgi:hypothetical protein
MAATVHPSARHDPASVRRADTGMIFVDAVGARAIDVERTPG